MALDDDANEPHEQRVAAHSEWLRLASGSSVFDVLSRLICNVSLLSRRSPLDFNCGRPGLSQSLPVEARAPRSGEQMDGTAVVQAIGQMFAQQDTAAVIKFTEELELDVRRSRRACP